MPRVAGVHLLGGLLAGIIIFFTGFIWFGLLFDELWMTSNGYTVEQIEASFSVPIFAGGGLGVPMILAFAIGWLMQKAQIKGLAAALLFGAKLGLFVAGPLLTYSFIYDPVHSVADLLLDISHSLVGFILAAGILSFFD